jgi:hypothetical protein
MGILVRCTCGKEYSVPDNQPGKRFRCYRCARKLRAGDATPYSEAIAAGTAPGAEITTQDAGAGSTNEPPDDVVMAELRLRERALRRKAAFRARLGLGCMIAGAVLCLGGLGITYDLSQFADLTPGGYITSGFTTGLAFTLAMGPIVLGAVVFLWGFKRWFIQ